MLPTLLEMEALGLLTHDEATEANCYASSNVQTWLSMPDALMSKVWAAWVLLDWEPEATPYLTTH